jgi:hypothetical protein
MALPITACSAPKVGTLPGVAPWAAGSDPQRVSTVRKRSSFIQSTRSA